LRGIERPIARGLIRHELLPRDDILSVGLHPRRKPTAARLRVRHVAVASNARERASKQLTKPTLPNATKTHQTAATRTPSATAQAAGKAAGAGLKEAIDRRGVAVVLGSPAPTAASVTAKLEVAQPSGPLGLTPGDIREAQRDPRNAIPPQAPRKAQRGLHIPSEADAPTQEELRAALARENQVQPPLIAVKRMSSADRRYAKGRIEDVIHTKNVAFKREREELNRWGTINRLYTAEITAGRFIIDMARVAKSDANTQLGDVVCLTNYPQGLGKHVQSLYDALDARQDAMKLEGARLLDEIMLGSPADAIVQIQRFESTKF
jgi:hypothetical protein